MNIKKRDKLNINKVCELAEVSRSGYYAFASRIGIVNEKELQDELDFKMVNAAFYYKRWKKDALRFK